MSVYGHGITTSKHGIDSADVTSVVASRKYFSSERSSMLSFEISDLSLNTSD